MHKNNDFETIDSNDLATTTGGDFAHNYVTNLKQDFTNMNVRSQQTLDALDQHNWGVAAKQQGANLLNAAGFIGDAIAPYRAIAG